MLMPSITLPTGPYDWHPENISRAEFEARLARFRGAMVGAGATHAVVHGNTFDHGGLAWLTGFTPKLGPAFALVAADGAPRLLFSGGPGMRPSAAALTWVEDVAALKGLEKDIGQWLADAAVGDSPRLGVSEGGAMASRLFAAVQRVAGGAAIELDRQVDAMRRAKSSAERKLIEKACDILAIAADSLVASAASGKPLRVLTLDAERSAYSAGAQDVRIRIGRRPWAPPVSVPDDDLVTEGPLRVALAVRHAGYWAPASFVIGDLQKDVVNQGKETIDRCMSSVLPGAGLANFKRSAEIDRGLIVCGIGLALHEAPDLAVGTETLAAGDVCNLTVRIDHGAGRVADWSSIALVESSGARVLWSPPR